MKTPHHEFCDAAAVIAVLGITRALLNISLCHVNRIPFNVGCVGLDAAAGNDSLSLQPSEPRINERRCHNCALLLVRINDNTAVCFLITSPPSLPARGPAPAPSDRSEISEGVSVSDNRLF